MAKGYAEGPAAEEAERRRDELERRRRGQEAPVQRAAVYGSTEDEPESHFIAWREAADPDELFASGRAWGLTVVRVSSP